MLNLIMLQGSVQNFPAKTLILFIRRPRPFLETTGTALFEKSNFCQQLMAVHPMKHMYEKLETTKEHLLKGKAQYTWSPR
jgi:hypothetical protein